MKQAVAALRSSRGNEMGRRKHLGRKGITSLETALMLSLAEGYLSDGRFEEYVKDCRVLPSLLLSVCAEDREVDELELMPEGSEERIARERFLRYRHARTPDGARALAAGDAIGKFAQFCVLLDRGDPLFWQKVFMFIGLPFDPETFQRPGAPE